MKKNILDKILIITTWNKQINISSGGPSGFIAHNFSDKNLKYFDIYRDGIYRSTFKDRVLNRIINKAIPEYGIVLDEGISRYKYLFFHDTLSLYNSRGFINKNHVIILQSHSPQMPYKELLEMGETESVIAYQREADFYSFDKAHYLVFPNEYCLKLYDEINIDSYKVRYILSGVRTQKTLNYPLDKSKINFLYIGRRNEIKGFDIVLNSFRKAYEINKNIRLIIAGDGNKIQEEVVWDIGFTSNILNWIDSVDFVINANRQSYFDLSVLETLSVGTPIILSSNFGHCYFNNKSKGIITFDIESGSDLINIILNSESLLRDKKEMIFQNKRLYQEFFTDDKYFERFISFFESIRK